MTPIVYSFKSVRVTTIERASFDGLCRRGMMWYQKKSSKSYFSDGTANITGVYDTLGEPLINIWPDTVCSLYYRDEKWGPRHNCRGNMGDTSSIRILDGVGPSGLAIPMTTASGDCTWQFGASKETRTWSCSSGSSCGSARTRHGHAFQSLYQYQ